MANISGKVVVITGGSRGIGAATARVLAARGCKLVLASTAKSADELEKTVESLRAGGADALAVRCDVADEKDCEALVQAAVQRYGSIDFFFCNAGFGGSAAGQFHQWPGDELRRSLEVNVLGIMFCIKYAVPVMKARGGGCFVFNSSLAAHLPASLMTPPLPILPYMVAKAAVDQLTRAMATYLSDNIKTYCVAPAVFATKMVDDVVTRPTVNALGMRTPSDWAGLNPVFKGNVGDPVHIGTVVASCFDGTTRYAPCSTIIIDNDVTFNSHDFHVLQCLPGPWRVPYAAARDLLGNPKPLQPPADAVSKQS